MNLALALLPLTGTYHDFQQQRRSLQLIRTTFLVLASKMIGLNIRCWNDGGWINSTARPRLIDESCLKVKPWNWIDDMH